ncbi:MAG: lysine--tRNA ligase [Candidatus Pacebacteria bacterium]|nr:lysine--tRNA ligase [Candidatus Paceibacterota bacterium]MDD5357311.1 lysine--tRNA ligase [Candidatus Paceibacterota bacterium]
MASLDELKNTRLAKLKALKDAGVEAYPADAKRDESLGDVVTHFDKLSASGKEFSLVGRVMSLRGQGALIFSDIFDGTGKLQILLKSDEMSGNFFKLFQDTVDIGDFLEVHGTLFVTKRGEKTLQVKSWKMLTKSLLPLPEKWHGLTDVEERFRKRYLDILMDPEIRELFVKKTKFWDVTRSFMKKEGFMEVETPTLEVTTGGAEATPFKTHHEDFDLDVFMRISIGELWQKRLMAAGYPKTFEIGRAYRNEGTDVNHVQEFTNLEFYLAYANYEDGMKLVEKLYQTIAKEVFGTTKFTSRGVEFDFSGEWKRMDYRDTVKKETGIDVLDSSDKEIEKKLKELKITYDGTTRERMIDTLWKYCRKKIAGPVFLVNHPKIVSPLAKSKPENPELTERFQIILAGTEVGNGFSELNDPVEQRKRFETQQELLKSGDKEAMMADWEFVEMLEHGMPPTCGFGFGESLFAILADKPIREVQIFPLMRPKDGAKE